MSEYWSPSLGPNFRRMGHRAVHRDRTNGAAEGPAWWSDSLNGVGPPVASHSLIGAQDPSIADDISLGKCGRYRTGGEARLRRPPDYWPSRPRAPVNPPDWLILPSILKAWLAELFGSEPNWHRPRPCRVRLLIPLFEGEGFGGMFMPPPLGLPPVGGRAPVETPGASCAATLPEVFRRARSRGSHGSGHCSTR